MLDEYEKHCDLVQFNTVDHYNNNTLKVVHTIGFLKQILIDGSESQNVRHIMMIDDDSYLNVHELYDQLYGEV